ncbi:polysaccharide deacetylase family protein [Rhizobium sp. KVB221]|uniref:Chitooligosaccharide deacetylase n=1 Tax=Rhizobium setariae TaxID=2801340 RepID=A0A936YVF8_9HYPH|nr:polysaccharide deacetylase family protein [Rhizobium setariae]
MVRSTSLLLLVFSLAVPASGAIAPGHRLLEPSLRLAKKSVDAPEVALTFDACMGKVDHRILDMLVTEKIAATIFVTARWLKRNPDAFAVMKAHPDLFEIEDHGANHVPAVEMPISIYGIRAAGSPEAVAAEVAGGADAIIRSGSARPTWFRGATAKYSAQSMVQIEAMGFRVAGFSINGDGGATLGARETQRRFAAARDGDVIIAHINQPDRKAGEGVVAGVRDLKKRGYRFVLLRDQPEQMGKLATK